MFYSYNNKASDMNCAREEENIIVENGTILALMKLCSDDYSTAIS